MEQIVYRFFLQNWPRKAISILAALLIWFFVNHSISDTKTIPGVPIRIVNLPADKTIDGLLPNGILRKRIALTLTGSKDIIHELEPGDLEVLIDASNIDREDWVLQINKKNLVSLNPAIDLGHHLTSVTHNEYILRFSKLVTCKIPITILTPAGDAPLGYEYLDIWPQKLLQTMSGPEEELQHLKLKGFELSFDLNDITQADLDAITESPFNVQEDELSFLIPLNWKEIPIPFHNNALEEINDPDAQNLRIDFLRKEYLPIKMAIPIQIFYPLKTIDSLNPDNLHILKGQNIEQKNGITIFTKPLYVYEVSRLFLEIVKENLQIVVVAAPNNESENLLWTLEIINPKQLEDTYVAYMKEKIPFQNFISSAQMQKSYELMLRNRFKFYMHKIALFTAPNEPLILDAYIENNQIKIRS